MLAVSIAAPFSKTKHHSDSLGEGAAAIQMKPCKSGNVLEVPMTGCAGRFRVNLEPELLRLGRPTFFYRDDVHKVNRLL